jgi:ferredoxin
MLANFGYQDGSGIYHITIDTDKCDGCGKCVEACPYRVLEIVPKEELDPLAEGTMAMVTEEQRKKIRYACAPCKPYLTSLSGTEAPPEEEMKKLPCVAACPSEAIRHSW